MSATARSLLGIFGMTDAMIPLVLGDLSDADARRRSRDGSGPSIAWMVGHLLHYRYYVLGMLGQGGDSPYAAFAKDADDGSAYPTTGALIEAWGELAGDFERAISAYPDADWDQRGTFFGQEKTVRERAAFFAWHEGYHMGALGQLRKTMGYPGPAERMMAARGRK